MANLIRHMHGCAAHGDFKDAPLGTSFPPFNIETLPRLSPTLPSLHHVAFLISLIMLSSGCQNKTVEPQKTYEKYRSSVVLVRSRYYYSVYFNNGSQLFFVPGDRSGPPTVYQDESEAANNANASFGTGFFISWDGRIATSRWQVDPLSRSSDAVCFIVDWIASFKNGRKPETATMMKRTKTT
jgi:hypothetical protein